MAKADHDERCDAALHRDDTPDCRTGPLGRMRWTVRELAALLRRRGHGGENDLEDRPVRGAP
jgi:hypothetical protein